MTSGETAAGNNPVESIQAMNKINTTSELHFNYIKALEEMKNIGRFSKKTKEIATAISSKLLPSDKGGFPYEFCFLFTNNEELIEAVSASRPGATIIACITDPKLYTYYGVEYGIKTFMVKSLNPTAISIKAIVKNAMKVYKPYTSNKKVSIAISNGKTLKSSTITR
jgi:pyruvate kinase